MPSAADIRAALTALRNAGPGEKNAAKARVTTLGAQTALEITDPAARSQFVNSLDSDINDAMEA